MQHTVIALMQDRPGALNRVVSLFRRRAFNIDSLSVATTEQPGLSRMTLVVNRDEVTQVIRQLERLIDVVSVRDVTFQPAVAQELCLVRLGPPGHRLGELLRAVHECDARVLEAAPDAMLLAVMGPPDAVSECLQRLRAFGIAELTRSGRIAMTLSASTTTAEPSAHSPIEDGVASPYTWQADGAIDHAAA
jgi:acetolactate synthase-1/3 small subunit